MFKKNSIALLVALGFLTAFVSDTGAQTPQVLGKPVTSPLLTSTSTTTTPVLSNTPDTSTHLPSTNLLSNIATQPLGPPCKTEAGSTACRWDNIQVEHLNSRLLYPGFGVMNQLVIKGKDKELYLFFGPDAKPPVVNAVASCERMALSSREGSGLFSFYAMSGSATATALEEGFQNNKVIIQADNPTFSELGCFISGS